MSHEHYPSVEAFFKANHPELVGSLNSTGHFWERVRNNSIPTAELESVRFDLLNPNSAVYRAALALRVARRVGMIADPAIQAGQ